MNNNNWTSQDPWLSESTLKMEKLPFVFLGLTCEHIMIPLSHYIIIVSIEVFLYCSIGKENYQVFMCSSSISHISMCKFELLNPTSG